MAKGGLLKTLRKYNPLKRVSITLILIVLLIIILFSVFNRKIIENLAPNNTSKSTTGGSTTGGSTTGGSTTGGSSTGGSTTGGSTTGGSTPIRTNNKYLEVNLWYDKLKLEGSEGERINLFEELEREATIAGDKYVIFNKNEAKDYIAFFMTDPSFTNLRDGITKQNVNWETWKTNFIEQYSPLISFSVLDKSQGDTIARGAKRKYLSALWKTMPGSYDILNFMLVANKYANEIGVVKP